MVSPQRASDFSQLAHPDRPVLRPGCSSRSGAGLRSGRNPAARSAGRCAVVLEERQLLIEARGIEMRVLGPFEAFESTRRVVDASIHQNLLRIDAPFAFESSLLLAARNRCPIVIDSVQTHR